MTKRRSGRANQRTNDFYTGSQASKRAAGRIGKYQNFGGSDQSFKEVIDDAATEREQRATMEANQKRRRGGLD